MYVSNYLDIIVWSKNISKIDYWNLRNIYYQQTLFNMCLYVHIAFWYKECPREIKLKAAFVLQDLYTGCILMAKKISYLLQTNWDTRHYVRDYVKGVLTIVSVIWISDVCSCEHYMGTLPSNLFYDVYKYI